jgi:uncharacterized protein (TIGR03067 family)
VGDRARESSSTRTAHEKEAAAMKQGEFARQWEQLEPMLDDEVAALPEKFRVPLVLHHLHGYSEREAAKLLGLNEGTFSSRISRGRDMLRERLGHRGVVLAAGIFAELGTLQAGVIPPAFVTGTAKAAALITAGNLAAAGAVSAPVLALTKGAMNMLFVAKLKVVVVVLAVCSAFTVTGATVWTSISASTRARQENRAEVTGGEERPPPMPSESTRHENLVGSWRVTSVQRVNAPRKFSSKDFSKEMAEFETATCAISLEKFIFSFGKRSREAVYVFEPDKKVSAIDFKSQFFPFQKDGAPVCGVYTLKEDRLRLSVGPAGSGRPNNFLPSEKDGQLFIFVIELERVKASKE